CHRVTDDGALILLHLRQGQYNAGSCQKEADMNEVANPSHVTQELDHLAEVAEDILQRAQAAGATAAEVTASVASGLDVSVRLGELEAVERNRDRGFALTVYFDQRKGSASTADLAPTSIAATVAQACAIAKYTEADPCSGLADAARM